MVLLQHPGVIASVIVGIPDTRLTEMVVACVKLREHWQWSNDSDGGSLTGNKKLVLSREILRQHCREKKLTGYGIKTIVYVNIMFDCRCLPLCCLITEYG